MTDPPEGSPWERFHAALLIDDPETLYEQAPCGYLSTTADGLLVKVNQTFTAMIGQSAADLLGRRSFSDLLTPGGRIYYETHVAPMLAMQGQVREIALDLIRSDGSRLPVLVNAVLARDEHGTPSLIRTAVFDATERRSYEHELLAAKRRAEESEERATTLARTLQQTLIPPETPQIPGLDVAAVYRPAGDGREVGGDFYDIFELASGEWVIIVGDVQGKGVEAAVVTSLARYTLRGACVTQSSPADALRVLNGVMLRQATTRHCTVCVLRLKRQGAGWRATFASGGHPLPVLSTTGQAPTSVGSPGMLIGILGDVTLPETQLVLGPGDCMVIYTDGITEARREGEQFGSARLEETVGGRARSAESVAHSLVDGAVDFQSGTTRDDIAVVVVAVPLSGT
jgi:sigma-B regulation protein RsbU (phosphoserine phosphatase)